MNEYNTDRACNFSTIVYEFFANDQPIHSLAFFGLLKRFIYLINTQKMEHVKNGSPTAYLQPNKAKIIRGIVRKFKVKTGWKILSQHGHSRIITSDIR